jgi:DnaJ-class molecular chaperone
LKVIVQRVFGREDLMPRTYYERDEDWLIACPECHGTGTIGAGVSRTKCSKCNGAGKIKTK